MYFITHRHLVFNLLQSIVYAEVALVDQAVCVDNVAQNTLRHFILMLKNRCIDAVVHRRIAIHNDVGRHIFRDAATCLNENPASDVGGLVQNDVAAQDGVVVYLAFAGHGSLDAQHAMIADLYVVAEVYAIHQVVIITDTGASVGVCGAADNYVLADVVVVADNQYAFFTHIVEILRLTAQYSTVMHFVSFSYTSTFEDFCARHDDTIISDFHIAFDVNERLNGYILTDFCGRIY